MDFEMLKQVGVNVESAMERFMGNNALYAKMLKKILYEPAFGELVHAVSACDTGKRRWRRLIRCKEERGRSHSPPCPGYQFTSSEMHSLPCQ